MKIAGALLKLHLQLVEALQQAIAEIDARVGKTLAPVHAQYCHDSSIESCLSFIMSKTFTNTAEYL